MLRYIDEIWMPHVKEMGKEESILTLDSFSAQVSNSTMACFQSHKVHTSVIPGGCTSVIQPLDVCLSKPFKVHLKASWQRYMLQD